MPKRRVYFSLSTKFVYHMSLPFDTWEDVYADTIGVLTVSFKKPVKSRHSNMVRSFWRRRISEGVDGGGGPWKSEMLKEDG